MNACRGHPKPLPATTASSGTGFGRRPKQENTHARPRGDDAGRRQTGGHAGEQDAGLDPVSRTKLHIRPAWWSRIGGDDCSRGGQYADERPGSEPSPLSSLLCLCRRPADFSETQHEVSRPGVSEQHIRPCGRARCSNVPLSRRETTLAPCISASDDEQLRVVDSA